MSNDPIEVLTKSRDDARKTARRAQAMGDDARAAGFTRWADSMQARIDERRSTVRRRPANQHKAHIDLMKKTLPDDYE